jgi:glycosyltransferase involved in cell wall biosynthesis
MARVHSKADDMNIGLIIGQIEKIGGMEKQAALLARELKRRGNDVLLFISGPRTSNDRTDLLDLESMTRKHLYHKRYSKHFSKWLLRRYCSRNGISHLIAFNVENAEIAVSAKLEARIAMSVRGTKFSSDALLARKYADIASRCDIVITNSENTAEMVWQSNIAAKSSVRVIHNGIELPDVECSPKRKMILYVGSLKEVKDPLTFVRACHEVIKIDDQVRVTMVGEGSMRPSIEEYVRSEGLVRNFAMTGEIPYDGIPYGETSVFVNSSIRESSCNSLLEALSFGIPSVATANSGNSEILSRLSHHRLVPVSNVHEMAAAIHSLLNTGLDLRLAIFEESRGLIREHYSVSRMVDGYIESFLSP